MLDVCCSVCLTAHATVFVMRRIDAPRISRREGSWPRVLDPPTGLCWLLYTLCCTSRDHYSQCQFHVSIVAIRRLLGPVSVDLQLEDGFRWFSFWSIFWLLLLWCYSSSISTHPACTCVLFGSLCLFEFRAIVFDTCL